MLFNMCKYNDIYLKNIELFDKLLLQDNIDINYKYNDDYTLLHCVCEYNGNYELAEKLLKNKINIDEIDRWERTALMVSCYYNYYEITELLLKYGANINYISENYNETPLRLACTNENSKIIKLLINNGAKLNNLNHDRYTELIYLCLYGNLEMIKLLFQTFDIDVDYINRSSNSCIYSLTEACDAKKNSYEIVKFLLEKGVDINIYYDKCSSTFTSCDTALSLACHRNNLNVILLLLDNNYKVHSNEYNRIINDEKISDEIKYEIERSYIKSNAKSATKRC